MIIVNGDERDDVAAGMSVERLLDVLKLAQRDRGVAVAVGAEVVPRADWATTTLAEGDVVEVLVAVQGG